MAPRALLRADQMRDADNLTEYEHDVLVHENLVTSGTLTVSGTSGDIGLTTDGSQLLVDGSPISTTLSGVVDSETYESTVTTATTTITLDFDHENYGVAYINGVRQQATAYTYSGDDQVVFSETLPSGTEVAFTHLVAEDSGEYYTKSEVDDLIAGLQSQIDALLAL